MLYFWKTLCSMMHVVCSALFWIYGLILLNSVTSKKKDMWFLVALVSVCAAIVLATSKNLGDGIFHLLAFPLFILGFIRY